MSRTRLRQLEQVRNSFEYDDLTNMGIGCEVQPSAVIGSSISGFNVAGGNTITFSSVDLTDRGFNAEDQITITSSDNSNDGTYPVISVSYSAPDSTVVIDITGPDGSLNNNADAGDAQPEADPTKNLARDLDHIRTQLRKLNRRTNWYDEPLGFGEDDWQLKTGDGYAADATIPLADGATFDAGEPYTFKVYLNGQLMLPSVVESNAITIPYDYAEFDTGASYVGLDETGNAIKFHYAIDDTDLIQFKWTKDPV